MTMITLLTDFGTRDGYVGVMRGVIWGIAPEVRVADLSHEIGAQNILEAALTLGRSFHFFPTGTIHLAVIDPGVGTSRRPIAAARYSALRRILTLSEDTFGMASQEANSRRTSVSWAKR